MRISECPEAPAYTGGLSLILPLSRGQVLNERAVDEFRRILEKDKAFGPIEIIAVGGLTLSIDSKHVELDEGVRTNFAIAIVWRPGNFHGLSAEIASPAIRESSRDFPTLKYCVGFTGERKFGRH